MGRTSASEEEKEDLKRSQGDLTNLKIEEGNTDRDLMNTSDLILHFKVGLIGDAST